jgi:hypothetical protein
LPARSLTSDTHDVASDSAALIVRTIDLFVRGSATGTLKVSCAAREGSIALVAGRIAHVHAPGAAPLLGELLGIDREPDAREGWIGERLRRSGLTDPGRVTTAHREQMRARLFAMMTWRSVRVSFEAGTPRVAPGVDPAHAADLVIEALRRSVESTPIDHVKEKLGSQSWALTALGRSLVARAALHPEEAAVAASLRSSIGRSELEAIAHHRDRALRFVYALSWIEAIGLPTESGSMSLLARKATEVRRSATPRRLLDMSAHARPAEARGALRRLAKDLHPDRFAVHASAAITDASTQVVAAMVRAAASVR